MPTDSSYGVARPRSDAAQGEILWTPPPDVRTSSRVGAYLTWLQERRRLTFPDYESLWRWSVSELEDFWLSIAEYFQVRFHDRATAVLTKRQMPGGQWFPGATLNFAEHALAGPADDIVFIARSETRDRVELRRGELRRQVAALRRSLERLGVRPGDRVVGYLPSTPEALITLYAAASLGAIFTACSPESGPTAVINKVGQLKPTVLVTVDGYVFGGQRYDRRAEVASICAGLPSLKHTIAVPYLYEAAGAIPGAADWRELVSGDEPLQVDPVPFDHPLYIVYSSGTTGAPKPIVHGHGGLLLEHLKLFVLHDDLGPQDRWFWYSSTNWMAWNYAASALLPGGSVVMFDGNPMRPDLNAYWRMVSEERVTWLGTSPAFMRAVAAAGIEPGKVADLSALRAVNSGGAPLSAEGFRWVYRAIKPDVFLSSSSGGTDVASSFVSGSRLLPVRAGEIACRLLGVDAQAYSENGVPLIGGQGELVIRQPMPSMPVGFWGDPDGRRLQESYFSRFPGVWCHGDWVSFSEEGTCRVTGRSDATLNRGGVRLGTSEFYSVLDEVPEVADSLVVHLEEEDGPGRLILFVAMRDGQTLTGDLQARIRRSLREELSPRHQPDLIQQVVQVPRTISGKRMEVPVKRALLQPDAPPLANLSGGETDPLHEYRALAHTLGTSSPG